MQLRIFRFRFYLIWRTFPAIFWPKAVHTHLWKRDATNLACENRHGLAGGAASLVCVCACKGNSSAREILRTLPLTIASWIGERLGPKSRWSNGKKVKCYLFLWTPLNNIMISIIRLCQSNYLHWLAGAIKRFQSDFVYVIKYNSRSDSEHGWKEVKHHFRF